MLCYVFQFYVSTARPQCSIAPMCTVGNRERQLYIWFQCFSASFGISATVAPCSPVTLPMGLYNAHGYHNHSINAHNGAPLWDILKTDLSFCRWFFFNYRLNYLYAGSQHGFFHLMKNVKILQKILLSKSKTNWSLWIMPSKGCLITFSSQKRNWKGCVTLQDALFAPNI